jgi:hypothetical protein
MDLAYNEVPLKANRLLSTKTQLKRKFTDVSQREEIVQGQAASKRTKKVESSISVKRGKFSPGESDMSLKIN